MKTNDDRQHLTQAQLRLAVTLFWGPCQQVLLPARLKELAKVVNGAKNRYSIHRNLPLLTKVCLLYPLHILGYAGSFFTSLTSNSRYFIFPPLFWWIKEFPNHIKNDLNLFVVFFYFFPKLFMSGEQLTQPCEDTDNM